MRALLPILIYVISSVLLSLNLSDRLARLGPVLARAVRRLLWFHISFLSTIFFGTTTVLHEVFDIDLPDVKLSHHYAAHSISVTAGLIALFGLFAYSLFTPEGSWIDWFIDFVEKGIKPANVGHPPSTLHPAGRKSLPRPKQSERSVAVTPPTAQTLLIPLAVTIFQVLFAYLASLANSLLPLIVALGILYLLYFLSLRYSLSDLQRAAAWLVAAVLIPPTVQNFFSQEALLVFGFDLTLVGALASTAFVILSALWHMVRRIDSPNSEICLYWVGLADTLVFGLVKVMRTWPLHVGTLPPDSAADFLWGAIILSTGIALMAVRRRVLSAWECGVYLLWTAMGGFQFFLHLPAVTTPTTPL